MKKLIMLCTILIVLGMNACKNGKETDTIAKDIPTDNCNDIDIPDYSPNIEYLSILDTLFSMGLFNEDTLFLMYDRAYQNTDHPKRLNQTAIVYISHAFESITNEGDTIHYNPLRYIEFGYESHCDSHIYVCIYDNYYDENLDPCGNHVFCPLELLDSILSTSHNIASK